MKYDGVVIKLDDLLYLFILNPDENVIMDGINISEHECYKDLKDEQLMVVDVTFKDGTEEIDKIDLEEFIYGESYGRHDTFIYIHDLMLYSISETDTSKNLSLKKIIKKGEIDKVAIACINSAKKEILENK